MTVTTSTTGAQLIMPIASRSVPMTAGVAQRVVAASAVADSLRSIAADVLQSGLTKDRNCAQSGAEARTTPTVKDGLREKV